MSCLANRYHFGPIPKPSGTDSFCEGFEAKCACPIFCGRFWDKFLAATLLCAVAVGCNSDSATPASPTPQAQEEPKQAAIERDARYPARWWTPIDDAGAPGWEILPQEAGPGEVILSKRDDELGLLSNFAATPFEFHGKRYASLEGFWQMMKFPEGPDDERAKHPGLEWPHTRDEVAQMTAFEAKRAGDVGKRNMEAMAIDWVTFEGKRMPYRPEEPGEHYQLIIEATREKVRQNPEVQRVLLSTGDLLLKPDHHPEKDAKAAWRYYEILQTIRDDLRKNNTEK